MNRRDTQSIHDDMIRFAVGHLQKRFYRNIRADVEGFETPDSIDGTSGTVHRPDLTAEGRQLYVFEVETEDTIQDEHTSAQWPAFAEHTSRCEGKFWVVVPKGCRQPAEEKLQELGIRAQVWEI